MFARWEGLVVQHETKWEGLVAQHGDVCRWEGLIAQHCDKYGRWAVFVRLTVYSSLPKMCSYFSCRYFQLLSAMCVCMISHISPLLV